jgi:hypothetical protein
MGNLVYALIWLLMAFVLAGPASSNAEEIVTTPETRPKCTDPSPPLSCDDIVAGDPPIGAPGGGVILSIPKDVRQEMMMGLSPNASSPQF